MIWRLRDLYEWRSLTEIRAGVWVASRGCRAPLYWRARAAWEVLRGRADAMSWPKADDPTTWCSPPVQNSAGQQEGTSGNGHEP